MFQSTHPLHTWPAREREKERKKERKKEEKEKKKKKKFPHTLLPQQRTLPLARSPTKHFAFLQESVLTISALEGWADAEFDDTTRLALLLEGHPLRVERFVALAHVDGHDLNVLPTGGGGIGLILLADEGVGGDEVAIDELDDTALLDLYGLLGLNVLGVGDEGTKLLTEAKGPLRIPFVHPAFDLGVGLVDGQANVESDVENVLYEGVHDELLHEHVNIKVIEWDTERANRVLEIVPGGRKELGGRIAICLLVEGQEETVNSVLESLESVADGGEIIVGGADDFHVFQKV
ncbi:hypothetical protein BC937DRAFT_86836 [Endogone sp. FLAS-F59071]|nr:hypothetical protein BC937DRAFT_86836 [Endogone sp. FLAS-F59071]|eukprot:RUS12868.1 hypothetical protein BC937DRAFT_86836 [Endogone sp. FLAS-F59071]